MHLRTPRVADIAHKTVLVRVDYNVPLTKGKHPSVRDDRRIRLSLKTLEFLLQQRAKVVLIAHLGRPKNPDDTRFSLQPVAEYLQKNLKQPVRFAPATVGPEAHAAIQELEPGQAILLENLRFHPGEKQNDPTFSKKLSELADVYVNEAFSAAHRTHASVVGVTKHLPSFAGFALQEEVRQLRSLLEKPRRPFVVVLGGAKISDKVGAVTHLAELADIVLIGGAVANNFLKAEGLETYRSFVEETSSDLQKTGVDYTQVAHTLIEAHRTERMLKDGYVPLPKILYPVDVLAAPSLETRSKSQVRHIDLTHGMQDTEEHTQLLYLDIGPQTTKLYEEILLKAGTIFWNGPMGLWENALFAEGSKRVAHAAAASAAQSIIGGGDTIAVADHFQLSEQFTYISAAGGAALDFLGGKALPGLQPLLE